MLTAMLPAVTKQATSFTQTLQQHHIPSVLHPLVSIYHTPQPALSPSDAHSVIAPLHQLHCPVLVIGATREGAKMSVLLLLLCMLNGCYVCTLYFIAMLMLVLCCVLGSEMANCDICRSVAACCRPCAVFRRACRKFTNGQF
jgi:hypothetical protein